MQDGSFAVVRAGVVTRVTVYNGRLLVNGRAIELEVLDPRNRRMNAGGGESGARDVKAAMPGKVVRLLVEVGDSVAPGQGLVTLEAMKMQNEVRSPATGRVAAIRVREGDTVASGQVLVTLE